MASSRARLLLQKIAEMNEQSARVAETNRVREGGGGGEGRVDDDDDSSSDFSDADERSSNDRAAGDGEEVIANNNNNVAIAAKPRGLVTMLKDIKAQRSLRQPTPSSDGGGGEGAKVTEKIDIDKIVGDVQASMRVGQGTNNADDELTDLEKRIIRQVEYYFGDYNLPKDKFIIEQMNNSDGDWIPMTTMMTFKRLSDMTTNPILVMRALSKSASGLMEIDFDKQRIRRDPRLPLPELNDARRLSLQERTVFVAGFDREGTTLDELIEYFENNFAKVCNVRMRMHRQPDGAGGQQCDRDQSFFLGSAFVTFSTRQAAEEFLKKKLTFKDRKLFSKWQKDFFGERVEYNDEFNPEAVDMTVFVHGFDKLETGQEELASFFGQFPGSKFVRRRVFRDRRESYGEREEDDSSSPDWKFTGSVFVRFDSRKKAERFLEIKDLDYEGDKLKKMWQREFYVEKGKFRRELKKLDEEEDDKL